MLSGEKNAKSFNKLKASLLFNLRQVFKKSCWGHPAQRDVGFADEGNWCTPSPLDLGGGMQALGCWSNLSLIERPLCLTKDAERVRHYFLWQPIRRQSVFRNQKLVGPQDAALLGSETDGLCLMSMTSDTWMPSEAGFGTEELGSGSSYQSTKLVKRSQESIRNTEPVSFCFHTWLDIIVKVQTSVKVHLILRETENTFLYIFMCVWVLGRFSCVRVFVTLGTVARQAPLSMGFSRQESWNGLPWPPPGDLPNPGVEPTVLTFPALTSRFFTTNTT